MRRSLITMVILASWRGRAWSQSPQTETKPVFEVVSIKPTAPAPDGKRLGNSVRGGPGSADPGRLVGENQSLGNLLWRAYGTVGYRVSGPSWLNTEHYDFVAIIPTGATREQIPPMLQNMLEERFKLVAHHEIREITSFELVVAKDGPKFKPLQQTAAVPGPTAGAAQQSSDPILDPDGFPIPEPGQRTMTILRNGCYYMTVIRWSMRELAEWLPSVVGRPVKDATGLEGEHDFRLRFVVGEGPGGVTLNPSAEPDAPTIFEAIQPQLGLKLVQGKGPVDVLVIDHIEKVPTAN